LADLSGCGPRLGASRLARLQIRVFSLLGVILTPRSEKTQFPSPHEGAAPSCGITAERLLKIHGKFSAKQMSTQKGSILLDIPGKANG
jgi:hypothetical protein